VESVGNDRLVKFGKYRNIESPSVVWLVGLTWTVYGVYKQFGEISCQSACVIRNSCWVSFLLPMKSLLNFELLCTRSCMFLCNSISVYKNKSEQ
jgi:hypothetical protein